MNDQVSVWDVIKILWAIGVSIVSAIAAWMNKRVQTLEEGMKGKADVNTVNQRFASEKADHEKESSRVERLMTEHRAETRQNFQSINDRLDTIIERMLK